MRYGFHSNLTALFKIEDIDGVLERKKEKIISSLDSFEVSKINAYLCKELLLFMR